MNIRGLLLGAPIDDCPVCGGPARRHPQRTLARERFTAGFSGIESCLARGDFAAAAHLDERSVLGDQLVHQLLRCGRRVTLVTTEDPVGLGREPRLRRLTVLESGDADAAWRCAR